VGVRKSSEGEGGLRSHGSDPLKPHLGETSSELTRESIDVRLGDGGGGRLSSVDDDEVGGRVRRTSEFRREEVGVKVD